MFTKAMPGIGALPATLRVTCRLVPPIGPAPMDPLDIVNHIFPGLIKTVQATRLIMSFIIIPLGFVISTALRPITMHRLPEAIGKTPSALRGHGLRALFII